MFGYNTKSPFNSLRTSIEQLSGPLVTPCASPDFLWENWNMVQTVISPKGLSGNFFPREVPRVIRHSPRGAAPKESSRDFPWAKFSDNP